MTTIYFREEIPGVGDHVRVMESPSRVGALMRSAARMSDPTIDLTRGDGIGSVMIPIAIIGPVTETLS